MEYVPKPYQQEMIDWIEQRDVSALFCAPGLGKTAVSLHWIDYLLTTGKSQGVLVVAPIRVCSITWPNEVAKWDQFKWMTIAHLRTEEGRQAWRDGTADIYLINPEQLPDRMVTPKDKPRYKKKGIASELFGKNMPVDTFIWDELSMAKTHNSKRVKALRTFANFFKRRLGLTGTPVPNTYLDLFGQIRLLDDGKRLGKFITDYRSRWFEADYMGYKWDLKPNARKVIDSKLADLALVMKSEDYLDVPQVSAVDVMVTLTPRVRRIYKELEKELLLELKDSNVVALNAATLTMKLVQITSGCVYGEDRVVNDIHDIKLKKILSIREKHNEPMLILSLFKHEEQRLLANIPGSIKFHERHMDAWRAGKIQTFIAHPAQLSHGIDGLQDSCRIALWASTPYSNEQFLQTNARLIRTGQEQETIIYRVLATDTVDEAVAEALRTKSDEQSGLLNALRALQLLRN